MASINPRKDRDGITIGWQAQVRRKGFPTQSRTFDKKGSAQAWARQVEGDMERGVFVATSLADKTALADALDRYAREVTSSKKGALQEFRRIEQWKRHPFAVRPLSNILPHDIAAYRDARLKEVSPATARLELALISHIFTIARKEWGIPVTNPVHDVRMPAKSKERDRRLAHGEEEKLLATAKMFRELPEIISLALETAMRRSEIARLTWDRVLLSKRTIILDDGKSGGRKVPLSSRAGEILDSLPRRLDGKVFSTGENFITVGFTRICARAGIEDLRFHDLRHEATSRLFEKGLNPMQVAAITGHKTLQMLKRYTHLRAEDLAKMLG